MEMNETPSFLKSIGELIKTVPDMPIPTGPTFKTVQELITKGGGFKRGEFFPLMAVNPNPYPRTNILFHMVLKRMQEDPNYKPVIRCSLEHDFEYFDEKRFQESLKAMGIELTTNEEGKLQ
jgi:hypothetical protein